MKKKIIVAAIAVLTVHFAGAQPTAADSVISIYLVDTNLIKKTGMSAGVVQLSSPDTNIQHILDNYTVYSYEKSYSSSRFLYMHQYYAFTANNTQILNDLLAYSPVMFPWGEIVCYTPAYIPDDYGGYIVYGTGTGPGSSGQHYLDYINAPAAWDITHGDPNVIIGITDTYFDLSHPDMSGQYAQVRENNLSSSAHGTNVAGILAGKTDNNDGLSSIGFDCRLDVSNHSPRDIPMLEMSSDGRRILNGSWFSSSISPGSFSVYTLPFAQQGLYNEIYENGTIPFFGAANFYNQGNSLESFVYPASLDHCMSVTSVGSEFPLGTMYSVPGADYGIGNPTYGGWNWRGVHKMNAFLPESNPKSSHHHNIRVDLAAPGYFFRAMDYDASDPGWHYWWNNILYSNGTSFASPLAAGTAGLMLSACHDQCLSPYQIEYILKTAANSGIYNISYLGDLINAPYAGKLGAGALDAEAAVNIAQYTPSNNACNDPATKTFYIQGVELNTVCAPGFSSNDIKPKLIPVLENGTPPYIYKWEPVPNTMVDGGYVGNTTTLDAYNIAEPTIMTSVITSPLTEHTAYYRLTVYDNSPIQKVADKIIHIPLKTSGWDLASRDLYMDMLDEPNTMATYDPRTYNVWKSPDIWNRWEADDQYGMQKPEYFTTDSNYLYVRVRNVGCEAAPATAKLQLYWTVASTTEHWKTDWDGTALFPGTSLPLGKMITPSSGLSIPALQPGESVNIRRGWRAPDPDDYYPGIDHMETCFLARIEQSTSSPYGMTIPELTNMPVSINVINNNNIATHNTWSTDFLQGNQHFYIMVGGVPAFPANTTYTLQLVNDKYINKHFAGDLSSVISTTVTLDKTVYNRWKAGGFKGTYANKNDATYQVTFDGMNMELQHIELKNMELFPVKISFKLINGAETTDYTYTVHFRQIAEIKSLHNPIVGNGSYELNTKASSPQQRPSPAETGKAAKGAYSVYPNPTHDMISVIYEGTRKEVTLQLADLAGRVLLTKQGQVDLAPLQLSLAPLPAGMYILTVKDQAGATEQFKVVKQ